MTYTCTTAVVQTGIVRTGLALAHTSKNKLDYHDFDASVAAPTGDTSSFVITVTTNLPLFGMRTAFFLIIIKTQTVDKMIDFATFGNFYFIQNCLQVLQLITIIMQIEPSLIQLTLSPCHPQYSLLEPISLQLHL